MAMQNQANGGAVNDGMPAMKEASAETGSGGTSYGAPTATDLGWHAAFD